MAYAFYISAGELSLEKKLFIKEMLQPQSPLKTLLNYELEGHDKKRILTMDRTSDSDRVIIDFTQGSSVEVGEDYQDLLKRIKEKYRGKIKGRIVMHMEGPYSSALLTLDLNGDDGRVMTAG